MATTLYFHSLQDGLDEFGVAGAGALTIAGASSGWSSGSLRTTRSTGVNNFGTTTSTVAGPTNGVETQVSGQPADWLSPPVATAVTISGSITWNLWADESDMSANVAVNARLEKVDAATAALTVIDTTTRTVECAIGTETVNNFSETPGAGVTLNPGDRLRVVIFFDDSTNPMGAGFDASFNYAQDDAGAGTIGDSWFTLSENVTFSDFTTPTGTTLYLTSTVSDVATSDLDLEMWTTVGTFNVLLTTPTSGYGRIQATDSPGLTTPVTWFSKRLEAVTLSGPCSIGSATGGTSGAISWSAANGSALALEIAVVDNDGSNANVWAVLWPGRDDVSRGHMLSGGNDFAVTGGRRIRFRWFLAGGSSVIGGMAASFDAQLSASSGTGMPVKFNVTLTEFTGAAAPPPRKPRHRQQQLLAR